MRHYLWFDTDGQICGCATYDGGFPAACDPRDQNTLHPVAVDIRKKRFSDPNFSGWVAYDCPCPTTASRCQCPHDRKLDSYVDTDNIIAKPISTFVLDGTTVAATDLINLKMSPGTTKVLTVVASVPDGHTLPIQPARPTPWKLMPDTVNLVFKDGQSSPLTITSPEQGVTARASGYSKYVRCFSIRARGWA